MVTRNGALTASPATIYRETGGLLGTPEGVDPFVEEISPGVQVSLHGNYSFAPEGVDPVYEHSLADFYGNATGGQILQHLDGAGNFTRYAPGFGPRRPSDSGSVAHPSTDAGKTSIDLLDIAGSAGDAAASLGKLGAGLFGGVLGAAGQIGVPGGPTLGDVPGAIGQGLGAIGSVPLPYLGNDPTRTNATLGDVPGEIGNILGAPEKAVERTVAGQRVEHARSGSGLFNEALPPDLQDRLDNGASVSEIADELVARNAGFTNNPVTNFIAGTIFDPTNLLSLGIGRVAGVARDAYYAAQAGEKLGVGGQIGAIAYRAAARGLPEVGQGAVDKLLGGTTAGVFHVVGTKPYVGLRNAIEGAVPEGGAAFEDAFARGIAQLPNAVVANMLADEVKAGVRKAESITPELIAQRVAQIPPDKMARMTEELLSRVAPRFDNVTDLRAWAVERLPLVVPGLSPEDAARILPKTVDRQTARIIDEATYGAAGDSLATIKRDLVTAPNIDVQRLTLLSPRSLTRQAATDLIKNIGKPGAVEAAVQRFDVLGNRFGSRIPSSAEVRDFLKQITDTLPEAVERPKTGRNPLPGPLGQWRQKWGALGYDIGFAPDSLVKTIRTADGEELFNNPFVHFVSERDPLGMRNPMGRLVDGMFRGISQQRIVQTSRDRFTDAGVKFGLAPNEARAVHSAILHAAKDAGTSPRGLDSFDQVFERVLGPSRLRELRQKVDPAFMVMDAFRGDLSQVGLTQLISGNAKRATAERGNVVARIAEGVWPAIKFRLSPVFQFSELIESPLWNALRGIWPRKSLDPMTERVYSALGDLPEFKNLFEGYASTYIAGAGAVRQEFGPQTLIGKTLSIFPNVAAAKERQRLLQTVSEHGDEFKDAVQRANPRAWLAMTEAYGTTDASQIASQFLGERLALANGDASVIEAMKPALTGADSETVWNAFRTSLEEVTRNAFQTHYFNPTRGWVERSLNHPYLGLYPLSYYKKVAGEFTRFLVARPFGLRAPLAGYEAVRRARDAMTVQTANDPAFRKFLTDNGGAIYLFQLLIPATPDNLPINAPAIARHLAADQLSGKPVDPAKFISGESGDLLGHLGAFRDVQVGAQALGNVGNDLAGQLERTAKMLDGMFPRGTNVISQE